MSNEKFLKYYTITIALIFLSIIASIAIWFYYEVSKINLDRQVYVEMADKNENIVIIDTSNTIYPINNAPYTTEELIEEYDKAVDNLNPDFFVKDFESYVPGEEIKNLNESQISNIAEKGFEESAKRIAGEGASNKETETIVMQEIIPNNYFTRKYQEKVEIYKELKMNAYVVTRENEMHCEIKIYIDPSTELIVGGEAYGD